MLLTPSNYAAVWTRAALKVVPSILECWSMTSEADIVRWSESRSWTFPPVFLYILLLCDWWQQREYDKLACDIEVLMKQRVSLNSSIQKKVLLIDICQHLLNVCGDQTVTVSAGRQWVVCFSNGNSRSWGWCNLYEHGIQVLVHCWRKWIANCGDYVEKEWSAAENLLYQTLLMCCLYLSWFPWK